MLALQLLALSAIALLSASPGKALWSNCQHFNRGGIWTEPANWGKMYCYLIITKSAKIGSQGCSFWLMCFTEIMGDLIQKFNPQQIKPTDLAIRGPFPACWFQIFYCSLRVNPVSLTVWCHCVPAPHSFWLIAFVRDLGSLPIEGKGQESFALYGRVCAEKPPSTTEGRCLVSTVNMLPPWTSALSTEPAPSTASASQLWAGPPPCRLCSVLVVTLCSDSANTPQCLPLINQSLALSTKAAVGAFY